MHIVFMISAFLAGGILVFLVMRAKSARESMETETLKKRLEEAEGMKPEADAARIAAAKALAALEAQEKQTLHERELMAEAQERELRNLREAHGREVAALRERFQEELAGAQRAGEEQRLAQARAFETERKALKETFAVLEQQFRENKAEMEKNWQTKIELLKEEFKTLSAEILKEKSGHLADVNQNQLSALLKPLQEKLGDFKNAVEQAKEKGISLNSELKEQIAHLMSATKRIGENADNLASALKGNNKTQGNWGEMILEEILVNSGLKRGIHYECQETLRDEDGNPVQNDNSRLMRPDVIVHYPDGKDVIIDSKVSLSAYTDYMNAESDEERKSALARHNRSVRAHVEELVRKNYSSYIRKQRHEAVDFVIMFIPNEASHQLAMIQDPGLWRWAFERKVMIVSPVNLMALLQLIQIAWTRADQERNQQKILDTASTLLDRLYSFYEQFDEVGKKLDGARDAYQKSLDKLKGGGGKHSVVLSGEQLKQLGVKMKRPRPLPVKYQDNEVLQLEAESAADDQKELLNGKQESGK